MSQPTHEGVLFAVGFTPAFALEKAMRQIRDAAGVEWVVYEVIPNVNSWRMGDSLPEGYRNGWLCFESCNEKRRLTPLPEGWQQYPVEELSGLIGTAVPVRSTAKYGG